MAKFETNLNKKDKITIAVVLFVGVMFCFCWYLIKPAVADIRSLSDEIEQAEVTRTLYRNKIMSLSTAEPVFNRAVEDLHSSTDGFYEIMQSSTIDRMMTNYVLGFGLFPEDLYITMPSGPVDEIPYVYSEEMRNQTHAAVAAMTPTPTPDPLTEATPAADSDDAGTAANQSTVVDSLFVPYNQAKAEAIYTSSSGVVAADVSIIMTGDEAVCQALIDDIVTNPSVRVRGFTWMEVDTETVYNEETGVFEIVVPDYSRLRIDLRLYMTNVTDYDALVNEAVESAGAEG